MKTRFVATGISILIIITGLTPLSLAQDKKAPNKERIGIYDSRSVAIASAGSPYFKKQFEDLKAKHEKAKAAGDEQEVRKLEAQGQAWQKQMHRQGFSTAPVDDILAHIADSLPKIRESNNVSVLVSKWDKAELAKHPGAEQVDVTMQLVDALQPGDQQRKFAIEAQKHPPIPLEQADKIEQEESKQGQNRKANKPKQ